MASLLQPFLQLLPLPYLLAICSGILYGFGFCGFDQYYLAWFCLTPVLIALDAPKLTWRQAVLLGALVGTTAHLVVYTWLVYMLEHFAFLPWPIAVLLYMVICLLQGGSLFGCFGFLCWLLKTHGTMPLYWAAPVAMVLSEWLSPAIFPSYLANSQYLLPIVCQCLDTVGTLGLGALLTALSALLSSCWQTWRHRRAVPWAFVCVTVLLWSCNLLYGLLRSQDIADSLLHREDGIQIGLVQPNVGIEQSREDQIERIRRLRSQSEELAQQGAQLLVWPESSFPYHIEQHNVRLQQQVLGNLTIPLIFGGTRSESGGAFDVQYNTAFALDGNGTMVGFYDKQKLLAFGEYIPFGDWLPLLYKLSPQTGKMEHGRHNNTIAVGKHHYGILICYEDILPGLVRAVMTNQPQILLNLTMDAWFGPTNEPKIHMALATARAIEQRRYLLRATDTGMTTVIDPIGRVIQQAPLFTRANLLAEVFPMQEQTIYQYWGDWIGWLAALLMLASLAQPIRKGLAHAKQQLVAIATKRSHQQH